MKNINLIKFPSLHMKQEISEIIPTVMEHLTALEDSLVFSRLRYFKI